jgi:hypothetical protein
MKKNYFLFVTLFTALFVNAQITTQLINVIIAANQCCSHTKGQNAWSEGGQTLVHEIE